MQRLAERQRDFAEALLNPELPAPPGLVGPNGGPSSKRFAVYRNNVVAGLTETLKDAFPAVQRIVGADFFHAMARAYVAAEPPRTPILLDYGAGFPDFIRQFEPAASLPYLGDVARIERAWTEAYHAPEASPLDPAAFTAIEPSQLPEIRLLLHPSVRVVRSQFPALTIWQMNIGDGVPAPVDLAAGGEDVLVVRPVADVEVRSVPGGSLEFILALAGGMSVLAALTAAISVDPGFDLSTNLSGLMHAGALVGYTFAREEKITKIGEAVMTAVRALVNVTSVEHAIEDIAEWLSRVALAVAPPLLRVALAVPFFKSGLTKWDGFLSLSPAAVFLFEDEFKLHIFGQAYEFPLPTAVAFFDGVAEIVLPVLLVIGLATRFSALGLLIMTGVIQLVVPEGWANFHLPWAALAVATIALGAGTLSLDHLIDMLRRPRIAQGGT